MASSLSSGALAGDLIVGFENSGLNDSQILSAQLYSRSIAQSYTGLEHDRSHGVAFDKLESRIASINTGTTPNEFALTHDVSTLIKSTRQFYTTPDYKRVADALYSQLLPHSGDVEHSKKSSEKKQKLARIVAEGKLEVLKTVISPSLHRAMIPLNCDICALPIQVCTCFSYWDGQYSESGSKNFGQCCSPGSGGSDCDYRCNLAPSATLPSNFNFPAFYGAFLVSASEATTPIFTMTQSTEVSQESLWIITPAGSSTIDDVTNRFGFNNLPGSGRDDASRTGTCCDPNAHIDTSIQGIELAIGGYDPTTYRNGMFAVVSVPTQYAPYYKFRLLNPWQQYGGMNAGVITNNTNSLLAIGSCPRRQLGDCRCNLMPNPGDFVFIENTNTNESILTMIESINLSQYSWTLVSTGITGWTTVRPQYVVNCN